MKNSIKVLPFLVVFLLLAFAVVGQDNYASNVRTEIVNNQKMLIKYDLIAPDPSALFDVSIKLTNNSRLINYSSGMMGDFGTLTTAGRDKAIVWYFKVDGFQGDIEDVKVSIQADFMPTPKADFEFEILGDKLPYKVAFQNKSLNSNSFIWSFDDPSSGPDNNSSLENPEHTYLRSRSYTVNLVVTSSETGLTDSISKQVLLNRGELPVANFNYNLTSKKAPSTGWFKNTSRNAQEYYWNFGDSDSGNDNHSAKKNPVHVFSKPGRFKVVLTVTNTESMERHSHTKEIIIGS